MEAEPTVFIYIYILHDEVNNTVNDTIGTELAIYW